MPISFVDREISTFRLWRDRYASGDLMNQSRVTTITLLLASALIGACTPQVTNPDREASGNSEGRDDACSASYITPAGNLKGSGFEIPIGKWAGGPIKIGTVQYDHSEAQKLSEAAQRVEQARLTFCRATSPAVLNTLPATDRKDVVLQAITSNEKVQTAVSKFVTAVANANTPAESVAAAADLKQTVEAEQKKVVDKAPAAAASEKQANRSPYEPQSWSLTLALMQAESADGIRKLSDKVDVLAQRLDNGHPRGEIMITGFNDNGVTLPAAERQRLYSQFQDALGKIPESQRPVVLVVGYANKSGAYLKNIALGLRRAQTVMSFLQEQKFSRGYEGHVMSGGIEDSAYAQRVDIFVTGA